MIGGHASIGRGDVYVPGITGLVAGAAVRLSQDSLRFPRLRDPPMFTSPICHAAAEPLSALIEMLVPLPDAVCCPTPPPCPDGAARLLRSLFAQRVVKTRPTIPATAPTPRMSHHHQSAVPLVRKLIAKPTATVETTVSVAGAHTRASTDLADIRNTPGYRPYRPYGSVPGQ